MQSDVDFLGLTASGSPGAFRFSVLDRLTRFDGRLYGGSAIAVSIAAAELTSARPALWMTTQFVSTVGAGADVDVAVDILAAGKRTNQIRVTATSDTGDTVFASLGATGILADDGLEGAFEGRPTVAPPEQADEWKSPMSGLLRAAGLDDVEIPVPMTGFTTVIEMREPEILEHPDPGPGRVCLWVRRKDGTVLTPALTAFIADVVPIGIIRALGVLARGWSLDNSMRIGRFVDTEWILLDVRPQLAVGGYGHGLVHVWSESGHLLATASQTASMAKMDLEQLPSFIRPQAE